jgi:hypothetical protein
MEGYIGGKPKAAYNWRSVRSSKLDVMLHPRCSQ